MNKILFPCRREPVERSLESQYNAHIAMVALHAGRSFDVDHDDMKELINTLLRK